MQNDTQDDLPNPTPTAAAAGGPATHPTSHKVLHDETAHPETAGSTHTGHPAQARNTAEALGPHTGHEKAGHHEKAH
jgi:hypothetical protein